MGICGTRPASSDEKKFMDEKSKKNKDDKDQNKDEDELMEVDDVSIFCFGDSLQSRAMKKIVEDTYYQNYNCWDHPVLTRDAVVISRNSFAKNYYKSQSIASKNTLTSNNSEHSCSISTSSIPCQENPSESQSQNQKPKISLKNDGSIQIST